VYLRVWMSCRASTRTLLATKKLGRPGDGLRSERAYLRIGTTVRSAVLTGVGNGKRMSYRVQGLVASPCPALTNNLVGARGKRILSVAGSNLLRSRITALLWSNLLAFITRPGPSTFIYGLTFRGRGYLCREARKRARSPSCAMLKPAQMSKSAAGAARAKDGACHTKRVVNSRSIWLATIRSAFIRCNV
jgi:hypothetical protein